MSGGDKGPKRRRVTDTVDKVDESDLIKVDKRSDKTSSEYIKLRAHDSLVLMDGPVVVIKWNPTITEFIQQAEEDYGEVEKPKGFSFCIVFMKNKSGGGTYIEGAVSELIKTLFDDYLTFNSNIQVQKKRSKLGGMQNVRITCISKKYKLEDFGGPALPKVKEEKLTDDDLYERRCELVREEYKVEENKKRFEEVHEIYLSCKCEICFAVRVALAQPIEKGRLSEISCDENQLGHVIKKWKILTWASFEENIKSRNNKAIKIIKLDNFLPYYDDSRDLPYQRVVESNGIKNPVPKDVQQVRNAKRRYKFDGRLGFTHLGKNRSIENILDIKSRAVVYQYCNEEEDGNLTVVYDGQTSKTFDDRVSSHLKLSSNDNVYKYFAGDNPDGKRKMVARPLKVLVDFFDDRFEFEQEQIISDNALLNTIVNKTIAMKYITF